MMGGQRGQNIGRGRCYHDLRGPAATPVKLGQKERHNRKQKERELQEGAEETRKDVELRPAANDQMLGDRVGLALEPLHAGKDEQRSSQGCDGARQQNKPP